MIDLTNVALRRTPHDKFEGPFIGPCCDGFYRAIIDRSVCIWHDNGNCIGSARPLDLIPYTPAPVARKWLRCEHGLAAPMIERAPVDALVEALRGIRDSYDVGTYPHDIASAALAAWEAGL